MCVFVFVFFIKISKFALPGVMLMYERTSNERKKEKKTRMEVHEPILFPFIDLAGASRSCWRCLVSLSERISL